MMRHFGRDFNYKLDYKQDRAIERRLNIPLTSNLRRILIGVGVVILVVFIGTKIKDKYYRKAGDFYSIELFVSTAGGPVI